MTSTKYILLEQSQKKRRKSFKNWNNDTQFQFINKYKIEIQT